MSLLELVPLVAAELGLQSNQIDEWELRAVSNEYGHMRAMSCRLTLCCGHQIPLAVRYSASLSSVQREADIGARRKLIKAIFSHTADHDCAAYALARVTARLKQ